MDPAHLNGQPSAHGMSDVELEAACRPDVSGAAPWIYWTSELYCLGKCLRAFAGFPRALPLFVYADHGVALHSNLFPHETANDARVHLVFHPQKEARYRALKQKRIVRVAHPWIHYRRSRLIRRSSSPKGTLAFVPHHAPGVEWEGHLAEAYFESLRALPANFQPVVLCLHMHDINAGLHKELRRLGFPLVTAGDTSSVRFVDRFYRIVSGYAYATSQRWGSQVAYCVELGVPFFFLGKRPRLVNVSHADLPLGEVGFQDEQHERCEREAAELFKSPVDEVTPAQRRFVESLLGLDSGVTRARLAWILWREFFRHWKKWWPMWLKPACGALRRHGLPGFLRKLVYRLRSG